MNPFPGKLFNKPTGDGTPGTDVYAGCKIDYSGSMVTPETFVKVLTGDAAGLDGGKVLQSTKLDRVFVNFVDHGGSLSSPTLPPLSHRHTIVLLVWLCYRSL